MEDIFQIDPDILRQKLIQKCSSQVVQIVQLEAAVQQLLTQVETLTAKCDAQVHVEECEESESSVVNIEGSKPVEATG